MRDFEIDIQPIEGSEPDGPASLAIGSRGVVFTHLLRQGANAPSDHLEAPPGQLAFWLVDNWWRLRSECVPAAGPSTEWRLAHDLAGLSGFAWPRLAIWGEGDRVGLSSRSDPMGVVGPVRYLTDALTYVPAAAFEREVDEFLHGVAAERAQFMSDAQALRAQVATLGEERADPDIAAWRRLEAQLGYDVDQAPEALMEALAGLQRDYGAGAVAEAAMATQGDHAAEVLKAEIETANAYHWQCDLRRAAKQVDHVAHDGQEPPWSLGEAAAAAVRAAIVQKNAPLTNAVLSDVLGVRSAAFKTLETAAPRELAYGLRLNTGRRRGEVVALASRWSADRRFEFSRALGDAVWAEGEYLGPLTRAKTERQKFQRAFAQSLLCPYEALLSYIGDDMSDGALAAASRHFRVSERLVRSVLVNKGKLARHRISNWRPATADYDEVVEAA
jgi:hypothetical protein